MEENKLLCKPTESSMISFWSKIRVSHANDLRMFGPCGRIQVLFEIFLQFPLKCMKSIRTQVVPKVWAVLVGEHWFN